MVLSVTCDNGVVGKVAEAVANRLIRSTATFALIQVFDSFELVVHADDDAEGAEARDVPAAVVLLLLVEKDGVLQCDEEKGTSRIGLKAQLIDDHL